MSTGARLAAILRVILALAVLGAALYLLLSFVPAARRAVPALFDRGMSTVALQVFSGLTLLAGAALWFARHRIEALVARLASEIAATPDPPPTLLEDPPPGRATGRVLLAFTLVLAFIAVGLAVVEPSRYFALIDEDGLVEYVSAVLWMLAASCMAFSLLIAPPRMRAMVVGYTLLALFFFVCGGEEVSWGQRILGRESGEFFGRVNKQNETNLHNIGSISIFSNLFFLFSLAFFVLRPWLIRRHRGLRNWLAVCRAPWLSPWAERTYRVGLVVFVLVGVRFQTLGFSPFTRNGWYNQMDDEIFEFFAALSFFAFALLDLMWRRAHRGVGDTRPGA